MKQAELGLNLTTKRTRKREFLAEMERVVPWAALVELIAPYAPEGRRGRPPFALQTMLRIVGGTSVTHQRDGVHVFRYCAVMLKFDVSRHAAALRCFLDDGLCEYCFA